VVPVVNDAEHNRVVLTNQNVRWARPTIGSLADEMSSAFEKYVPDVGKECAASVANSGWRSSQQRAVEVFEQHLMAPDTRRR